MITVEIRLPDGASIEIELVHLDELVRRGLPNIQGSILYWEGIGNQAAADAMRRIRDDGERLRLFFGTRL